MTSVPEYGLLTITPLPVFSEKALIISLGNPFGYVGSGFGDTSPAISQCPIIVSLPIERSMHLPTAASGDAEVPSEDSPSIFPIPILTRLGIESSGEDARVPSVFAPTSPKSPASGRYPAPTLSSTIRKSLMVSFPPPCG